MQPEPTLAMKMKLKKAQTQRLMATKRGSHADGTEWKLASLSAVKRSTKLAK